MSDFLFFINWCAVAVAFIMGLPLGFAAAHADEFGPFEFKSGVYTGIWLVFVVVAAVLFIYRAGMAA